MEGKVGVDLGDRLENLDFIFRVTGILSKRVIISYFFFEIIKRSSMF